MSKMRFSYRDFETRCASLRLKSACYQIFILSSAEPKLTNSIVTMEFRGYICRLEDQYVEFLIVLCIPATNSPHHHILESFER